MYQQIVSIINHNLILLSQFPIIDLHQLFVNVVILVILRRSKFQYYNRVIDHPKKRKKSNTETI